MCGYVWCLNLVRIPDADSTPAAVDIADLTLLVGCMFKNGPALNPVFIGDLDGNCSVDIADLTYLVAYMFKNGPEPKVGCYGGELSMRHYPILFTTYLLRNHDKN